MTGRSAAETLQRLLDTVDLDRSWKAGTFGRAFAVFVLEYRAAHQLSTSEMATLAGLSWHTLDKAQKGTVEPRMSNLLQIAKALHVSFVVHVSVTGDCLIDWEEP